MKMFAVKTHLTEKFLYSTSFNNTNSSNNNNTKEKKLIKMKWYFMTL